MQAFIFLIFKYLVHHCVKTVRIWSYSGPHFPAFGLDTERFVSVFSPNAEKEDQNNPEYGHFSGSNIYNQRCIRDSHMSGMGLFRKIKNGFKVCSFFQESSFFLDACLNPESDSAFSQCKFAITYLFFALLM